MLKRILSEQNLPWLGAIIAALIACWVNYQAHGVINNDGTLYLDVARLFDAGKWQQGFATYNWPLYPLLIMLAHNLTGLSLQISANLLTIVFFSFAALGIATLIRESGGDKTAILAGMTLLISTPYLVGDILPMIVREHGYWAAQIWSLVYFTRFLIKKNWQNAFLWGITALLSVLFRIEGITYLLLLPAMALLSSGSLKNRLKLMFMVNIVVIFLGISLALVLLIHPSLRLADLGRLGEPLQILRLVYDQLTYGLANRSEIIAQALGSYLDDYAMPTLLLGMLYILLYKAATVGGVIQSLIAVSFWKKTREAMLPSHFNVLVCLLTLSLLNAVVILTKGFILPKRILSPIAFVTIIFAAHGISYMLTRARQSTAQARNVWKWGTLTVAAFLFLQAIATLYPAATEKRYELNAVEWVLANTPPGSRIFYQSERLRFYAGLPRQSQQNWASLQMNAWANSLKVPSQETASAIEKITSAPEFGSYDYYLLTAKGQQIEMLISHFGVPLKVFKGNRDKVVLVFGKIQTGTHSPIKN